MLLYSIKQRKNMYSLDLLVSGNVASLKEEVRKISLITQAEKMNDDQHRGYLTSDAGIEHYKLLAYISSAYVGQTIYDIGTSVGNSSLALSYSPTTTVISYDIVDIKRISSAPANVEYRIGDFRLDPEVLKAPFIFIDVDPHDGIQEQAFHEFFLANNYKGIVMWDDINVQGLQHWWPLIENVTKLDITQAGHWSGTGLTIYN